MESSSQPHPASRDRLAFSCSACGLGLSVDVELAGVKGPCPRCGAMISAPGEEARVEVIPPPGFPAGKGVGVMVRGRERRGVRRKGMIIADSAVDHRHQGLKETTHTLFIVMMFILAFCMCLVATWFLKDWIGR